MGISKLKIPKICHQCGKPFEAKTVTTVYCSHYCIDKVSKARKKQAIEEERTQTLLQENIQNIAEIQSRPYITIAEAVVGFGSLFLSHDFGMRQKLFFLFPFINVFLSIKMLVLHT